MARMSPVPRSVVASALLAFVLLCTACSAVLVAPSGGSALQPQSGFVPLEQPRMERPAGPISPSKGGVVTAHVFLTDGLASVCVEGRMGKCAGSPVASAVYNASLSSSGWDELSLSTAAGAPDFEQSYAAGFLEGALTSRRISAFLSSWVLKDRTPAQQKAVIDYIAKHDAWARSQVAKIGTRARAASGDREALYWYHVGLVMRQNDGMYDGFIAHSPLATAKVTRAEFSLLSNDGDVLDIDRFVGPRSNKRTMDMSSSELASFLAITGHCSALIKVTDDDLIVGHATWSDYREMYRIYKHFTYGYSLTHARRHSYSSYPGMVYSSDDFYVLDSGLIVTETTLTILNDALYQRCAADKGVLAYIRASVANMIARTGEDWVQVFGAHNSGTYNNQWMVVDMNAYRPRVASAAPVAASAAAATTQAQTQAKAGAESKDDKATAVGAPAVAPVTAGQTEKVAAKASDAKPTQEATAKAAEAAKTDAVVASVDKDVNKATAQADKAVADAKAAENKVTAPAPAAPATPIAPVTTNAIAGSNATDPATAPVTVLIEATTSAGPRGVFWLLEQIPGRIVAKDMTETLLSQGFWASYNRPFFSQVNEESFFRHFQAKFGELYTYGSTARAKMLHREQAGVRDVPTMQAVLRHNEYKTDEFARGCPWRAIAARFDIEGTAECAAEANGKGVTAQLTKPHGATDAKITSYKWRGQQKAIAVSGPARGKDNAIPAFKWSGSSFAGLRGPELPDVFDFDWMDHTPTKVPAPDGKLGGL